MSLRYPSFSPGKIYYIGLAVLLVLTFNLTQETRDRYGSTGNPSIDPIVFFKLMLTGYLENITSDRKLMNHCAMRMDILYFLGYDIDEPLPWHSTVSRTRQLYPPTIFESLFNKVFALCVAKRMVNGHTQALDSAPIKANASMESLELKKPFQSIERHFETVNTENQEPLVTAVPSTVGLITAPQHHLNRVKHIHDKLRKNPVGASGASHVDIPEHVDPLNAGMFWNVKVA